MCRLRLILLVTLSFAALASCDRSVDDPRALTIFVAASLAPAFGDLADRFEAGRPGVVVRCSPAGSQIIAAQILAGAQPDVFASADAAQIQRVTAFTHAAQVFARNSLVIAANPVDPPIESAADLARPGLRLVLATDACPAGRYARLALAELGLLEAVIRNIVSNEPSVSLALGRLALGEADAAIVYATDLAPLAGSSDLSAIPLAGGVGGDPTYHVAVLRDAAAPVLAGAFVDFLLSVDGAAILQRHGFQAP